MLKIVNLTCGYKKKVVISGIDFQVNNGEFWGVTGSNGSGKTTLLRALSGIIAPINGNILWQGKDIRAMGANETAREISVVTGNSSLNDFTVEEFILLGRIPYYGAFRFFEGKKDSEAVRKAMDLTGTLEFKNRILNTMSSGEKQLVFIARALAQEPKLLLLDEPTAHLDIAHQAGVLDLIRRLNKNMGITVIIVLHDLNLAGEYCHKLIFLDKGKIHKIGPPHEVFNYEDIEGIYKTKVLIERNPVSLRPYVVLVSEEGRNRLR